MFSLFTRHRIFTVFGIPVYMGTGMMFMLLYVACQFPDLFLGLAAAAVFFGSILGHELAHVLARRLFGCRTYEVELWMLGGFTLGETPCDNGKSACVAAAGPLFNLAVAGVAYALRIICPFAFLSLVLFLVFQFNLALGFFNLLPGLPLDGGHVFRSVVRVFMNPWKAAAVAWRVGQGVAILVGLYGIHGALNGHFGWGLMMVFIAVTIWINGNREYTGRM